MDNGKGKACIFGVAGAADAADAGDAAGGAASSRGCGTAGTLVCLGGNRGHLVFRMSENASFEG